MIILRIDFPHGVYRAAEPTAPDQPEYPPAPDRVFQALVASACEQGIDPGPLQALEAAPTLWLGLAERIHTGTNFVPGAFIEAGKHTPVKRERPEVRVTRPVFLCWEEATDDLAAWLGPVLAGVGYLGRADSPVHMTLASSVDQGLRRWVPDANGPALLRVSRPGRLRELLAAHAAGRRAPNALRVGYTDRRIWPSPWGEMLILRPLHGELHQAAQLGAALRAATMSQAPDPLPPVLHGHQVTTAAADHAAWVTLPDVGHPWARGAVLGVGMVLPRQVSDEERTACCVALARVERLGVIPVRRPVASETLKGIDPDTWSHPAQVWNTVTPIVLDRYPKRGQAVEALIADSVSLAGFPRPQQVEIPVMPLRGVPLAKNFLGRGPGHRTHARLHFAEPVRGPMLVGRGRYFGLGLLRPEVR